MRISTRSHSKILRNSNQKLIFIIKKGKEREEKKLPYWYLIHRGILIQQLMNIDFHTSKWEIMTTKIYIYGFNISHWISIQYLVEPNLVLAEESIYTHACMYKYLWVSF